MARYRILVGLTAFLTSLILAAGWGCSDSSEGDSNATTTTEPTTAASPTPCPVQSDVCAAAKAIEDALRTDSVAPILSKAKFNQYQCPATRPQGLGGPYPLCDSDDGMGKTLEGFPTQNDVTGLLLSREAVEAELKRATDSQTKDGDWRVRTVACRMDSSACTDALIVMGYVGPAGQLANSSGAFLLKVASGGSEAFVVETYTMAFALGDAEILLSGGSLPSEPAHLATFGYGPFHRWSTS